MYVWASSREKSGAGSSSLTFAATLVRTRVSASLACLNVRSVARQSASRIGFSSSVSGSETWLTRGPAALRVAADRMRVVERVVADAHFHGGEPAAGFVAALQCADRRRRTRGPRIVERVADEVRGRVLLAENLEVPLQLGLQDREGPSVGALERRDAGPVTRHRRMTTTSATAAG